VYYLLGEEFDRDPFLLFKLRGLSREELVRLLGDQSPPKERDKSRAKSATSTEKEKQETAFPREPLPIEPSMFWGDSVIDEGLLGDVRLPPVTASLPKRLGNFPFWRGEERFLDAIEPIYAAASLIGMNVFIGERRTGQNKSLISSKTKSPRKSPASSNFSD
jgi:uncharacterized Zn finger protein